MDMNKRALMALVMIVVLTFSACGAVGLTATKVSAATCSWSRVSAPTTGTVGDTLTFSITATKPFPQGLKFRFEGPASEGTISIDEVLVTGLGILGDPTLTYSNNYTFQQAGTYTVSVTAAENDPGCTDLRVVIKPITKLELTGPTTGTVGDSLTYTVKVRQCDAAGKCQPAPEGTSVLIQECNSKRACFPPVSSDIAKNLPYQRTGSTDAQGVAQIAFPFQDAGEYRMAAFWFESEGTGISKSEGSLNVTITATSDNTGGGSGGGSTTTSAATANETALDQTSSNATSSSLTPGFEISGALVGIALVALFMVNKRYR